MQPDFTLTTECSFMWHFLGAGDDPDLIECADIRTETAMDAQHASINNLCEVAK